MLLESFNNSQVFGSVCCFNKIEFHTLVARIFEFVLFIAFSAESDLWNWIYIVPTFHTYSHSQVYMHVFLWIEAYNWSISLTFLNWIFTYFMRFYFLTVFHLLSRNDSVEWCDTFATLLAIKTFMFAIDDYFNELTPIFQCTCKKKTHWLHINFEWCDDKIPGLSEAISGLVWIFYWSAGQIIHWLTAFAEYISSFNSSHCYSFIKLKNWGQRIKLYSFSSKCKT